jgi:hypothetical protein
MTVLAWVAPVLALTKEERLFLWVSVLTGVIILGGVFIGRMDRWRKRQMDEQDDAPEQIGTFRDMYERGELSKEEYDRVLHRMAERVGVKPKPKPVPAAAEETPPGPPAPQEPPPNPPSA